MNSVGAVNAVVARIQAVPGTANVYPSIRGYKDDQIFREQCLDANGVHCWQATREGGEASDFEVQTTMWRHQIAVYLRIAFRDGQSEAIVQPLVDAVVNAFLPVSTRRFNNTFDWSTAPKVSGPVLAVWRGVLVHYVRMEITVTEFPS